MNPFGEPLLKPPSFPIMIPMNQNYNIINQVPMPQLLPEQQNMQYANNINGNITNGGAIPKKTNTSKPQTTNPQDSK